jgi:2-iminobutanoate/2-iminopropanoate deaminase
VDRTVPVTGDPDLGWVDGLGYSQAVRTGDLVFSAGQGGFGADGNVVDGGFEAQLRQAFANVEAAIAVHGASLASIAKLTVYLVDTADYKAFDRVRREVFTAPFPASTAIRAGGLLVEGMLVEIDTVAVVGAERVGGAEAGAA